MTPAIFMLPMTLAVNNAMDEWKRRLSACVDAEDGHFEHCL